MPNAKVLSCTMLTVDESNHSATGTLHIYTPVPHVCSTLYRAVRFPPVTEDINPQSSN